MHTLLSQSFKRPLNILQVLRKRIGMSLRKGDDISLVGEQYFCQRVWTYQEVCLLADLTGFDLVATYGDLHLDVQADSQDAKRLVVCLQRPETEDVSDILASLS